MQEKLIILQEMEDSESPYNLPDVGCWEIWEHWSFPNESSSLSPYQRLSEYLIISGHVWSLGFPSDLSPAATVQHATKVLTYNSAIAACERAWQWTAALQLFVQMRKDTPIHHASTLHPPWPVRKLMVCSWHLTLLSVLLLLFMLLWLYSMHTLFLFWLLYNVYTLFLFLLMYNTYTLHIKD